MTTATKTANQTATLSRFRRRLDDINNGEFHVRPGMPQAFTTAAQAGDCIDQGDLRIIVVDRVGDARAFADGEIATDFSEVVSPTEQDKQLVLGNTQGAKHCLDSLQGVKLYRPSTWGDSDSLIGPCLVVTEDRVIEHPTHGHVTIPAGLTVQIRYPREWEKEQQKERRARD
jgi:hypothetical protein